MSASERLAQFPNECQPVRAVLVLIGGVNYRSVLRLLCKVECHVGVAEQDRGVLTIYGIAGNPDAAADVDPVIVDCEGLLEGIGELEGRLHSRSVIIAGQEQRESGLVDTTQMLLLRYNVPPSALRLEITETALMRDATRTLEILTRLAHLGIHLVIDDFGTGYSSLAYLRHLPAEDLKIDRSFVLDMLNHPADAAIISSTVGLGHGLGLRVIAEGVETTALWDELHTRGCDGAQGYYISDPRPADEITTWLARGAWKPT